MKEIVNPVFIFVAIILTIMASYTTADLFTLLRSTEQNKRFLFWGSVLSMTMGIWIMSFLGLLAIDMNELQSYHFPILVLAFLTGLCFTALAFRMMSRQASTRQTKAAASVLLMVAVLCIHIISIHGMYQHIAYQWPIIAVAALILCVAFFFAFWLLCANHGLQAWTKPVSTLVMTAAIIQNHFLLMRASSFSDIAVHAGAEAAHEVFIMYLLLGISVVLLAGLIGSSAFISKRLAASDSYAKDITAALDESSIVAITDPKGTITYVNDKFVEISGYNEEELIGRNHNILNSKYHSKEFFRQMWRTIGSGRIWKGEIRNRAKDGTYYWVDTTIVPFLDRTGRPYQYVSIRTDVTKRKQAEEELRAALREMSDIKFAIDQSSIVAFTDTQGTITAVNDTFCQISKYTREELIGQNHSILNSGYHPKEFFRQMWRTIGSGKVWKGEIRNRAKDGTHYWVDTTIVPFLDESGKPYQYLAIRNDITERKEAEEQLRRQDKLAAVGQMAAGIAHEIRNPLTSMKGYAEFLQLDETNPERQEYLNIILDEADRINSIVEEFLVLAKPKIVQLREQNVVPIIGNVVSLLEFEARKRQVRLHFDHNCDVIQVECDEDRLKQVFLNLIKNGIEAMPNGGDLYVRMMDVGQQVQISVQDTGVGIPEEKLNQIGEPFFTTKKNGNGLGLMVSFKIIESHHGKIYIESEVDKGTTFNVVLPVKAAS
nr:PAS domain S-box protein [Ectobacillus ponti]